MINLAFSFSILSGSFEEQRRDNERVIAVAATGAMDSVAENVKRQGRADIAAAGFSKRWQNALRVDRYPGRGRISMEPAVYVFHRIEYAGVFEDGARIGGNPYLWLPLSSTPQRLRGGPVTPQKIAAILPTGRLVSIPSRSGTPILGAPVRLSRTQALKDRPKVTLAALRRGNAEGSGILRTVPLFFGIRQTNVPEQLSIREICARARDTIPRLYAENFKAE